MASLTAAGTTWHPLEGFDGLTCSGRESKGLRINRLATLQDFEMQMRMNPGVPGIACFANLPDHRALPYPPTRFHSD